MKPISEITETRIIRVHNENRIQHETFYEIWYWGYNTNGQIQWNRLSKYSNIKDEISLEASKFSKMTRTIVKVVEIKL